MNGPDVDSETLRFLERYELGDILGGGASADVYRAVDRRSAREVAVKIARLRPCPPHGADRRAAAAHRAAAELGHHPGLVEVLDTGQVRGREYAVLQLVDGASLAEAMAAGPLPVDAVLTIGTQLAECLAHVHGKRVVHRDIKPANVLLARSDGRAYLSDFGVARGFDTTRVTASGVGVGTPAYMAPEQVRGETVGPATDVYSLGLVLLEALTGRREYPGGLIETAVARLHRPPEIPRTLPAALRSVLVDMTRIDPAQRPSAAAVAERLRGARAGDTTEAASPPVVPPTRGVAAATAAVVTSALAGVATLALLLSPVAEPVTGGSATSIAGSVPPIAPTPTAPAGPPAPDAGTTVATGVVEAGVVSRDQGGSPGAEQRQPTARASSAGSRSAPVDAGTARGHGPKEKAEKAEKAEKPGKGNAKKNGG